MKLSEAFIRFSTEGILPKGLFVEPRDIIQNCDVSEGLIEPREYVWLIDCYLSHCKLKECRDHSPPKEMIESIPKIEASRLTSMEIVKAFVTRSVLDNCEGLEIGRKTTNINP